MFYVIGFEYFMYILPFSCQRILNSKMFSKVNSFFAGDLSELVSVLAEMSVEVRLPTCGSP